MNTITSIRTHCQMSSEIKINVALALVTATAIAALTVAIMGVTGHFIRHPEVLGKLFIALPTIAVVLGMGYLVISPDKDRNDIEQFKRFVVVLSIIMAIGALIFNGAKLLKDSSYTTLKAGGQGIAFLMLIPLMHVMVTMIDKCGCLKEEG